MKTIRLRPIGVVAISVFYTLGAVALLISWILGWEQAGQTIAVAHGVLPDAGMHILPVIATVALLIACGLFLLSRWGYFLALAYLAYCGITALVQGGGSLAVNGQPVSPFLWGNLAWSIVAIVYLLLVRRHFLGRHETQDRAGQQDQTAATH